MAIISPAADLQVLYLLRQEIQARMVHVYIMTAPKQLYNLLEAAASIVYI